MRDLKKVLFLVLTIALGFTLAGCTKDPVVDPVDPDPTDPVVVDPACEGTVSVDGLFANKNLRVALAYAIDRELIVETMGAGQVPAGGMVPPGFLDDDGLDFFAVSGNYGLETDDTNFTEAVQLFALAAEEMGMTVAELRAAMETQELLFNNGHEVAAQLVQESWASVLGFTITLSSEEWGVFQDTRSAGNFDIARGGWLTDFMDPSGLLSIFSSNNAYNDPNYFNSTYDTLLSEALATTDMAVHFDKLYAAQEILIGDMPFIPIYHYSDTMLVSDDVVDWSRSVLGSVDFSAASIAGNVLNWNIGADPATLDPGLNGASDGGDVINQTFEALVREINGVVLPGIAESWSTSADGKTVTFNLRDSVWSDGSALTADDFVYSWLRGMDVNTASEYSWIWEYTNIVGAADFVNCGVADDCTALKAAVGVTAVDDNTLEVQLINPTSYFVSLMAFYHFMPVQQAAVEAVGGEDGTWAKDAALVVSNGPYMLTEYTIGDQLVLVKNPNYWNADAITIETINGFFNDDETSAYAAYQNGQYDYIPSVPATETAALIADSDQFYVFPLLGTYYYSFNMDQDGDGVNELGTVCED